MKVGFLGLGKLATGCVSLRLAATHVGLVTRFCTGPPSALPQNDDSLLNGPKVKI
jgi:hypothetical protein